MRKILVLSFVSCVSLWADTIPTLNATVFNYSTDALNVRSSWSGSGDGFSLIGHYTTSDASIYPSASLIYVASSAEFGYATLPPSIYSVTGMVGPNGAVFGGVGGEIIPDDPANYTVPNTVGTYSFAATATGSYAACVIPGVPYVSFSLFCNDFPPYAASPAVLSAYVSIDLPGIETVTVMPFAGLPMIDGDTYTITFVSNPAPEPGSVWLVLLGSAIGLLAWVYKPEGVITEMPAESSS